MTGLTQALSAALVDFIWQGAVVGLMLWLTLAALRPGSARVRYAVSCLALVVLALLPVLTMAALWTPPAVAAAAGAASGGTAVAPAAPQTLLTFWIEPDAPRLQWLTVVQQWALPVWTLGVVLFSIRLALGYSRTRALRRGADAADGDLRGLVSRLAARLGIARPVRLVISTLADGPSVVGWLRPAILLPPATAMGLTPQQLEAVVAHELAHIRRHDYVVNLLQIVVETLFFYHPVVWWVSKQIRDERELCCDDVVVAACGNPVEYARALATLARRRLDMPAFAPAATGGPLLHRVRRLLGVQHTEYGPSRAPAALAASLALAAVVLNLDWLQAQTAGAAAELPRFDVVSVKRNSADDNRIFNSYRNGRLVATGFTVAGLIRSAYQVQEFQIAGGPDWISRDRFDIQATGSPENASAPNVPGEPPRQALMLRALLDDRFMLRVHKETRQMPVYALVPARKDGTLGPRLTRSTADCSPGAPRPQPVVLPGGAVAPPTSMAGLHCGSNVGPGMVLGKGRTMAQLATALSMLTNTGSSLNRLIVDRTGLEGAFDIELRFTPENIPPGVAGIDPNGPSIFTAMQEQLGLKLESQRGPVDVLVIDRVEPPAED